MKHCVSVRAAIPYTAVIISIILRCQSRDMKNTCISWYILGSREAVGDPRALVLIWIWGVAQEKPGRASRVFLVPVYAVIRNTKATTQGAGESFSCPKRCREGGWLSQHRLREGTCKPRHITVKGRARLNLIASGKSEPESSDLWEGFSLRHWCWCLPVYWEKSTRRAIQVMVDAAP
jgi:hypothetical protein